MPRHTLKRSYWIVFSWIMLLIPAWSWLSIDREWLEPPESPVIRVRWDYGVQWRFLEEAPHSVLPGSSYTIRAATPEQEMSLFAMSLGLCTRRTPLPTSYFSQPTPEDGNRAEYVLAFRDYTGGEQGLQLVTRFRDGSVYRRAEGRRQKSEVLSKP